MNKNTSGLGLGLTAGQLRQAADLQDTIEASQAKLTALLTGKVVNFKASVKSGASTGKRTLTPEQRAKIAAGQKARWAKVNAAKTGTAAVTPTPAS